MKQAQTLSALFSFPGFRSRSRLQGIFDDPYAGLAILVRRKKTPCAPGVGHGTAPATTVPHARCGIPKRRAGVYYLAFEQRRVACRVVRG